MNWIVKWLVEKLLAKKLLKPLTWVHVKLIGKRSETLAILLAIAWILEASGVLPSDVVDKLELILGSAMAPTLLDKVTRYSSLKDNLVEELKKKLEKPSEKPQ